jgi:FKBP-type peptidyl-prolyl cis-trans isomerase FkpA
MKIRFFYLFLIIALLSFVNSSCNKATDQALRDQEKELLTKYIAKYHPTVTPKSSGLYYIETKVPAPTDTLIKNGDVVKIFYQGFLIEEDSTGIKEEGSEFDTSGEFEPSSFTVGKGELISGMDEALTYMKDHGEAKLIIPSRLAYSSRSQAGIPAYSPLIFKIKIYKVYRSTDKWPTIQIVPKI